MNKRGRCSEIKEEEAAASCQKHEQIRKQERFRATLLRIKKKLKSSKIICIVMRISIVTFSIRSSCVRRDKVRINSPIQNTAQNMSQTRYAEDVKR